MNAKRFEALYERYGDGQLTAEELTEFKDALRDPAFGQQLVDLCAFEAVVYDELNLLNEEEEARAAARSASGIQSATVRSSSGIQSGVVRSSSGIQSGVVRSSSGIQSGVVRSSSGIQSAAAGGSSKRIRSVRGRRKMRRAVPKKSVWLGWAIAAALLLVALSSYLAAPSVLQPAPAKSRTVAQPAPPAVPRRPAHPASPGQPVAPPAPAPTSVIAALAEFEDAVLQRGRGIPVTLQPDMALQAGDVIKVGSKGRALFAFHDQTRVELGPDTELELQMRGKAKHLVLKDGLLDANVAEQPPGSPLTIVSANAESTVVGTELSVLTFDKKMRLAVRVGEVSVRRAEDGSTVSVSTGHYVVAEEGAALAVKPLPEPRRLLEDFEGNDIQSWMRFAEFQKGSGTVRSWMTLEAGVEIGMDSSKERTGLGLPYRVSRDVLKHVSGKLGKSAMEFDFNVKPGESAGSCCVFQGGQDWSGYDGVRFWIRGQRSMGPLSVEIMDNAPTSNPTQDQCERFIYEFVDNSDSWREMIIPFRAFKRRANYQPEGAPKDGFTLTQVHGMGFMGSSGRGVFAVDQIELYRK